MNLNYYPFHLGDYASHTAHLEPLEDLAYRRMLDLYYRTEIPLQDADEVARLIRLRACVAEVQLVLSEFFDKTPEGWRHGRCDREIEAFAAMREGGRKGAAVRWGRVGNSPPISTLITPPSIPQCQPEPEPEPEPEPKKEKTLAASVQAPTPPTAFAGDGNLEQLNGKHVVALAANWELPESWGVDAESLGWGVRDVLKESEKFRQYWVSGKGANTRRSVKGWRQSWSNWLSKAERFKA